MKKYLDSKGLAKLINELDNRYFIGLGTDKLVGLTKLYNSTGNNIDGTMTQQAITRLTSTIYSFKGAVNSYTDLPVTANVGDVYTVLNNSTYYNITAGDNVAWNGSSWIKLSNSIDLSNLVKITDDYIKSIDLLGNKLIVTKSDNSITTIDLYPESVNLSLPVNYYCKCTTEDTDPIKILRIDNFVLVTGVRIVVNFSCGNTVTNMSFKVNNYDPISVNTNKVIQANILCDFIYDGDTWQVL